MCFQIFLIANDTITWYDLIIITDDINFKLFSIPIKPCFIVLQSLSYIVPRGKTSKK